MKRFRTLLALCLLGSLPEAIAQLPWALDSTYGQYGIAAPLTHSNGVWLHHMLAATIQNDGKIILAGTGNFSGNLEVIKLRTDGTPDPTFNTSGYALFNANGSYPWQFVGVKTDAGGRIMVAYYSLNPGNARFSVLCIRPNGTLDPSFGVNGKAEIGPSLAGTELGMSSMDIQADGKVVLAGSGTDALMTSKYVLARLTTTGVPDPSFGTGGLVKCPYFIGVNRHMSINVIKVQPDGKILAAGDIPPGAQGYPDSVVMIRYKINGTLDSTYGNNGIVRLEGKFRSGSIRIDASGNAYVLGSSGIINPKDSLYIHKYTVNGSRVTSFGTNGLLTIKGQFNVRNEKEQYTYPGRFELLSDGKMIVGGTSDSSANSDFRVMRLLADGTPDITFAANGTLTVAKTGRDICTDLLLQSDGRILLTGYYRTGEGTFDTARVLAMRFRQTVKPGSNSVVGLSAGLGLSLYPNPVRGGVLTLGYDNPGKAGQAHFSLINAIGQELKTGVFYIEPGKGSWTTRLDETWPSGLYYLQITTAENKKDVVRLSISN